MSNPCVFHAKDLLIGATSADILFHLGAEEISKSSGESSDRLARLVQHLFFQKRYIWIVYLHVTTLFCLSADYFSLTSVLVLYTKVSFS